MLSRHLAKLYDDATRTVALDGHILLSVNQPIAAPSPVFVQTMEMPNGNILYTTPMRRNGYIGIDLDGTLAHYTPGEGTIGRPLKPMVTRINELVAVGQSARIVTARGATQSMRLEVYRWLFKTFGFCLPVQNFKCFGMLELWDDRARQVVYNTGEFMGDDYK